MPSDLLNGLRLATGLLTVVPCAAVRPTRPVARAAMFLAPVAVLPVAAVLALVVWLGRLAGAPSLVLGFAVVGCGVLGTRAMHIDGLADVVDAFGGGWTRERAIEVMKRGDIGPMGATALVVVLGIQAACWAALSVRPNSWLLVVVVFCVSRAALSVSCAAGVPAMAGSSLGSTVAGSVPRALTGLCWATGTVLICLACVAVELPWWQGLIAEVAALLCVAALVGSAIRKFGGVNGDVMGAGIEVALTVAVVVLACR